MTGFGYNINTLGAYPNRGPEFYTATGGTVTTDGNYKVHSFTSSGTFSVSEVPADPASAELDYLIIAGGASGGANSGSGGGAGGRLYLENYTGITSTGDITVTVGAGGAGMSWGVPYGRGNNGANSVFNSITATGGGGGSGHYGSGPYTRQAGNDGGSGGGGGGEGIDGQGHDGGTGTNGQGGGGAGGAGSGSSGGAGVADSITGSSVTRAEGADGTGSAGGANTGTGGGRKDESNTNGGGSGIVIIRYKFQ